MISTEFGAMTTAQDWSDHTRADLPHGHFESCLVVIFVSLNKLPHTERFLGIQ
jgi:hypothetical protein